MNKKGRWNSQEDEALLQGVSIWDHKWAQVQTFVPDYTDAQCRERYLNVLDPKLWRDWTEEDIEKMTAMMLNADTVGKRFTDSLVRRKYYQVERRAAETSQPTTATSKKRKRAPAPVSTKPAGRKIARGRASTAKKNRDKSSHYLFVAG
ncbi:hypothetical protein BDK51DRAFT_32456 [Blyttiomyces helicus]|uniref:Uncharacterized protein n=1 Tax=Blyttiomyces helicus TaxID=388810 RepID=A0A4P9W1S7_9FUNG|nr:hypothetical protein BDK51DRAFT_32456 [Blyttiomyces helicus]|eukprot:RKO85315.1 hypothetical protein BDK51DRAFT_32456 [Blyttiomyces helicus]